MSSAESVPAVALEGVSQESILDPELLKVATEAFWAIKEVPETVDGETAASPSDRLLQAAENAVQYIGGVAQRGADGSTINVYDLEEMRRVTDEKDLKPEPLASIPQAAGFLRNRRELHSALGQLFTQAKQDGMVVDPQAAEKAAKAEKIAAAKVAADQEAAEKAARQAEEHKAKLEAAGPQLAKILADNSLVVRILGDGYHGIAHANGGKLVLELENFEPATSLRALGALGMLGYKESAESQETDSSES